MKQLFAIAIASGQAAMAAVWLEDVGVSVIGSINIAVAVGYGWYRLMGGSS